MLLIICGHIVMVHGYEQMGDTSWYIAQIVKPFCAIAVNVFVLISGYWGIKLKWRKLNSLNSMVTFYSLMFLVVSLLLGIHSFSMGEDWMQLVPVLTKQYWFITVYFALCLLSPFLNLLVSYLGKNDFQKLLLTGFGLFIILPTFSLILNFQDITRDSGYGIVNFMFLYLLGRYMRLYGIVEIRRVWYLISYVVSMLFCALFQIVYSYLLGFSFDSLISYNTIFVFWGSVSLFLYFSRFKFKSSVVNTLAVGCLAVYVLHLHPLFYEYFFADLLHIKEYQGIDYIFLLIFVPIPIYLCCWLIERVRTNIFSIVKLELK